MFVDSDDNSSNFPLAAFVFDENDSAPAEKPAYLCRFDALHLECFDTPLESKGLNSAIPFVGKIVGSTYFYGNGLAVGDLDSATNVRTTRPLFRVRNVNENVPDFDTTPYYVNRAVNPAMRCADLASFEAGVCFDEDGSTPCVSVADCSRRTPHFCKLS